jgi:plastocyanin
VSGSPITFNAAAVVPGQFAQVDVGNNFFEPASVTVSPGGTVSFRWASGARGHNIVPVAPATRPSQSTLRDGPFTHEETFPTAGTYRYFCSAHGTDNSGMRGTVVVQ